MDVAVLDPRTERLLMTVDEYCQLPELEDVIQELHWGQVVHLTRPKMKHTRLQYWLVDLLRPLAEGWGTVVTEMPFRALPEYDVRGADVALVSRERWNRDGRDFRNPRRIIAVPKRHLEPAINMVLDAEITSEARRR